MVNQTSFSLPELPNSQQWAKRCNADGEFKIAARHYTGIIRLKIDERVLELSVEAGAAKAVSQSDDNSSVNSVQPRVFGREC